MTRERWLIGGLGALVFVMVATGVVLAVGGDDSKVATDATTTTSTSSTTTTTLAAVTTTVSPPVTLGAICTTAEEAAQSFVAAWIAGDQAGAARCATPEAVAAIFQTSGAGAQYTWQGCHGDPGAPTCSYSYEGGGLNMAVTGTEATGWKVQSISYVAD